MIHPGWANVPALMSDETDDGRYRTYRGNILQRLGIGRPAIELAGPAESPVSQGQVCLLRVPEQ
jgi:hypothetical protein